MFVAYNDFTLFYITPADLLLGLYFYLPYLETTCRTQVPLGQKCSFFKTRLVSMAAQADKEVFCEANISVLLSSYLSSSIKNESGYFKSIARTHCCYLGILWLFGLLSTGETTSVTFISSVETSKRRLSIFILHIDLQSLLMPRSSTRLNLFFIIIMSLSVLQQVFTAHFQSCRWFCYCQR